MGKGEQDCNSKPRGYITARGETYEQFIQSLIYENGAKVLTCFSTNLEPEVKLRTAPELDKKIAEIQNLRKKQKTVNNYPPEVVTSTTFTAFIKRA